MVEVDDMNKKKRRNGAQWLRHYPNIELHNYRGWEIYADLASDDEAVELAYAKKKITQRQFELNLCYCSATDTETKFKW